MTPPPILFVAHNHRIGGAERSLLVLVGGLVRAGRTCVVVVPREDALSARLDALGVHVEIVPFHPVYWPGAPHRQAARLVWALAERLRVRSALGALARRWRPAVAHVNGLAMPHATVFRQLRIPVVWHVRELYGGWTGFLLGTAAARGATRLVFISDACQQRFTALGVRPPATLVPNGVEVPAEMPPADAGRARRVGIFSQLIPEKGHAVFLRAAALVATVMPETTFVIYGEDPAPGRPVERRLRRLAARPPLAGRVEFRGFVPEPEREMEGLGAVVVASREEPSGRVLLEASARGAPVIASRGGGVAEIVEDGVTGLLFPPGDGQACAERVLRVLGAPDLAETLRRRAFARVRERFSAGTHVAAMARIFDEVAAR